MEEINIICVGDLRYRFNMKIINHFDEGENEFRIFFNDGSILEYYKKNIICIEYVKGGVINEDTKGNTKVI